MLKLFISQPMKGKTDEEILQERNRIISMMQAQYGSVQVIDSFVKEDPPKEVNTPLWCLARSIKLLSEADVAIPLSSTHSSLEPLVEVVAN